MSARPPPREAPPAAAASSLCDLISGPPFFHNLGRVSAFGHRKPPLRDQGWDDEFFVRYFAGREECGTQGIGLKRIEKGLGSLKAAALPKPAAFCFDSTPILRWAEAFILCPPHTTAIRWRQDEVAARTILAAEHVGAMIHRPWAVSSRPYKVARLSVTLKSFALHRQRKCLHSTAIRSRPISVGSRPRSKLSKNDRSFLTS